MPLIDPTEYSNRRRESTAKEIEAAKGDYNKLKTMLRHRKELARTYAEDGAVQTARIIETVDVELIEAAIAAFY